MPDSSKRYVVVGTGSRADMYVTALIGSHADVGELVGICDTNPIRMAYYVDKAADAGKPGLSTYAAADFERMLDEQAPDTVIVTSPDFTHADYICAALAHDLDVVTEKPLTTDTESVQRILAAVSHSRGGLTITFNYRYSPRNATVKGLIQDGAIGDVTSVHFEWLLDTNHGADYFRRWHRDKSNSGGLLVHKSGHHFDLVNWWLADVPQTVFALGGLRFYGDENAKARGLGPRPHLSRDADPAADPFRLDIGADEKLRKLYLEAESADGYERDKDVFEAGISIEDNLSLVVGYLRGESMSYSLTAHAPWEGYRVAFNGTAGRLELEVVERSAVPPAAAHKTIGGPSAAVDPSALADSARGSAADELRPEGSRILLQKHWENAVEISIPEGAGGHGGGDAMLLDDVFRGNVADPLGRQAGYLDGVRSVMVGIAGNESLATGHAVRIPDFAELSVAESVR